MQSERNLTATQQQLKGSFSLAPDHTRWCPMDGNGRFAWRQAKRPSTRPIPEWPRSCIANTMVYDDNVLLTSAKSTIGKSEWAV